MGSAFHPGRRRLAVLVTSVLAAISISACNAADEGITTDTTCRDYLQFPGNERSDAAIRISAEVPGVSNPGNPMWALSLDAACGSSPSKTIREIFSHE